MGFELSLWHPIMDSAERVWGCNEKIIAKRGGFLCAPVPCGEIGSCGYIQDLTYEQVESSLKDYKALCESFPRGGLEWMRIARTSALRILARCRIRFLSCRQRMLGSVLLWPWPRKDWPSEGVRSGACLFFFFFFFRRRVTRKPGRV